MMNKEDNRQMEDFQTLPDAELTSDEVRRNIAEENELKRMGDSLPDEKEQQEQESVKKIMEAFTSDDGEEVRVNWSLSSVLGGDILNAHWFRKHAFFFLYVIILTILYITNRYASQQATIKIAKLKEELKDTRYDALIRSSELLQKCRQSQVEEYLRARGDTTLQPSSQPPIEIKAR